MASDYVREVGRVDDIDGARLIIGVDHDTVSFGNTACGHRFPLQDVETVAHLLVAATWEASQNAAAMAAEARDGA